MREELGGGLPPAFIVRNPHHDGRHVVQMIHHALPVLPMERKAERVRPESDLGPEAPFRNVARHILQHEQTNRVAMVVVAQRLDLYMLAHRIETALFQCFDVEAHRFVRRRRKKAVRPPALVERGEDVIRPVVQIKAPYPLRVFALLDLSHAEIARDYIFDVGIVILDRDAKSVQRRRLRTPQTETLRHPDLHRLAIFLHFALCDDAFAIQDLDLSFKGAQVSRTFEGYLHDTPVDIGKDAIRFEIRLGNHLHPHAAKDAGCARIETAFGRQALLSAGSYHAGACRIPYANSQFVLAGNGRIRYIERKRSVGALVRHVKFVMAEKNLRTEVDAVEMEYRTVSFARPDVYFARVPQEFVGFEKTPNPRKGRFHRKRHTDPSSPLFGSSDGVRYGGHGIIPVSVQAGPFFADHLRTRIFTPCIVAGDALAPLRHHRLAFSKQHAAASRNARNGQNRFNGLHHIKFSLKTKIQ